MSNALKGEVNEGLFFGVHGSCSFPLRLMLLIFVLPTFRMQHYMIHHLLFSWQFTAMVNSLPHFKSILRGIIHGLDVTIINLILNIKN